MATSCSTHLIPVLAWSPIGSANSMKTRESMLPCVPSGIGRATALRFATEGAWIVEVDFVAANHETVELIRAAGGEATAVQADIQNHRLGLPPKFDRRRVASVMSGTPCLGSTYCQTRRDPDPLARNSRLTLPARQMRSVGIV